MCEFRSLFSFLERMNGLFHSLTNVLLFQDHLDVCLKFPVSCILNCGQIDIPRDMMEDHVTTHCVKAEHLCPFSIHGCDFKVSSLFLTFVLFSEAEKTFHDTSSHKIFEQKPNNTLCTTLVPFLTDIFSLCCCVQGQF